MSFLYHTAPAQPTHIAAIVYIYSQLICNFLFDNALGGTDDVFE
jgi:hypothetical protein